MFACMHCSVVAMPTWRSCYEHIRDAHPDIWAQDQQLQDEYQRNIDRGEI